MDLKYPDWMSQDSIREVQRLAKREVNVAVLGKAGSGKSLLINSLCGTLAREKVEYDEEGKVVESELPAAAASGTREVACYEAQRASVAGQDYSIRVWDTPGLQPEADSSYIIRQLQRKVDGDIDILLYCVSASVPFFPASDMVPGMMTVTQSLGPDMWRHAVVILTLSNLLNEKYADRIQYGPQSVHRALIKSGVPEEIAETVPVEPAGHYKCLSLPDRPHWLGYLWLQFIKYARDEAKLAVIINNQHRIRDAQYLPVSPTTTT